MKLLGVASKRVLLAFQLSATCYLNFWQQSCTSHFPVAEKQKLIIKN